MILEALQVKPQPAGTARGILDLFRALAARDRGLDFTVLATEPDLFAPLGGQPGWKIEPCPRARGGSLRKAMFMQFRLPGLVRKLGGDILHCQQFLAPLRSPCPLVVTVHDLAWMLFPETIDEPRRTYYRWLVPRTLGKADAIVANSESTAREIDRHFPRVADKVHLTPHGTPNWVLERAGDTGTKTAGPDRPFFLFVGTMEPRKNLTRVLAAYETFLDSAEVGRADPATVPDLVFVGGKGWKDSGLRSRMGSLVNLGRLSIHDYCSDEVLWRLYRGALALVFPSLHEGFGLPVLEAMTAGLPVLTSNRGGMKEVAGSNALLVDPADVHDIARGLGVMAFDSTLRAKLANGGPDRAREWSWDRTADMTASVYRRLIEGRLSK